MSAHKIQDPGPGTCVWSVSVTQLQHTRHAHTQTSSVYTPSYRMKNCCVGKAVHGQPSNFDCSSSPRRLTAQPSRQHPHRQPTVVAMVERGYPRRSPRTSVGFHGNSRTPAPKRNTLDMNNTTTIGTAVHGQPLTFNCSPSPQRFEPAVHPRFVLLVARAYITYVRV